MSVLPDVPEPHHGCDVVVVLTPFLGRCPGRQDKTAVFCLQDELPMRMVVDEGEVERD